ncbi:hypothetical protein QN277_025187 [Acacia crassicarpa]|uniref:Uncharacterized protein n=1 Tax=Acacia crassicarpa TaxID=499986 RepID=A0AAE1MPW6_9FABA|nr:hypothetical protein QN277_025187 [Acacia crassicarpa]
MRTMAELQKSLKASYLASVSLLLSVLLWLSITVRPSMAAKEIPVGVILDPNSTLGIMVYNSLTLAVEDYYSEHKDTATKIHLLVRNVSHNDFFTAAAEASRQRPLQR